jgi:hypothetical protein
MALQTYADRLTGVPPDIIGQASYRQVAGPGNGLTGPGRNGPPIEARDRLGNTDGANESKNRLDFLVRQFRASVRAATFGLSAGRLHAAA